MDRTNEQLPEPAGMPVPDSHSEMKWPSPPLEIRHADGRLEHPRVKLETTDVRFWPILATVVGVAVMFTAVGAAARALLIAKTSQEGKRFLPQFARQTGDTFPQRPRLEAFEFQSPASKSYAVEARQLEAELHEYGPSSDEQFVRVPIEVAIQQMAKKLQSKDGPDSDEERSKRVPVSGDANSGRIFREARR